MSQLIFELWLLHGGTILEDQEKAVYTVAEIQKLLGIGKNQAYDLVNSGVFPVKTVGKKKLISKVGFHNWLNNKSV